MKTFRVIYMLESIDNNGNLVYRLFAANKRTAIQIARRHKNAPFPDIRKLSKDERCLINPLDVARHERKNEKQTKEPV